MPITLPVLPQPGANERGPYALVSRHRAAPGKADDLEQRMLQDLEVTRAEPGCLSFHIHRDRKDRDVFVIYEVWANIEALRTHYSMDFVGRFMKESTQFEGGSMDIQWLVMSSRYAPGRR